MAKKRRPTRTRRGLPGKKHQLGLTDAERAKRRDAIAAEGAAAGDDQGRRRGELRLDMMRSIVTEPLLTLIRAQPRRKFDVIIAINEVFEGGLEAALREIERRATEWKVRYGTISHYCFACLTGTQIIALAEETRELTRRHGRSASVVYRIWEDSDVSVTLTRSLVTVKADAAQRAFAAQGDGIVWAVFDSGIQGDHQHFKRDKSPVGPIRTLDIRAPVSHRDFTPDGAARNPPDDPSAIGQTHATALEDAFGHGTHVAGIIAGYWEASDPNGEAVAGTEIRDEKTDKPVTSREKIHRVSGVAPLCRIVSMKVIADRTLTGETRQTIGQGKVSWILTAIDQVQRWNQWGKRLLVHGVNMSLGYTFDPRWFACGHSPICAEVNRLVRSGVSVVVSAGNSGYPSFITASGKAESWFTDIGITDPGNADLAVTVGSTHREMPHTYGVSYFSSRGPTGDGRLKPDLLAPGERIISCAAGLEAQKYSGPATGEGAGAAGPPILYCEQTGTSMAAPHVSGAIAAFLSVRPEFIGQPERVKALAMQSATDLGRERQFQGTGLLDVMRLLQTV
ncbi:MAG: S8 family peptidase [Vicinamibacterales bacterium]